MKYIFIDHSVSYKFILKTEVDISCIPLDPDTDDAFSVGKKVLLVLKETDLIFINVDLNINGSLTRPKQLGVDILKYLRFYFNIMNHCVVYSNTGIIELIREKPENLILLSQGCTFLQIPCDVDAKYFSLNCSTKAERENLKCFVLNGCDVSKSRHELANIWGIKSLWDIHRIIKGKSSKEIESDALPKLSRINENFHHLIGIQALFLYGFSDKEIYRSILKTQRKWIENRTSEIREKISQCDIIAKNMKSRSNEVFERKIEEKLLYEKEIINLDNDLKHIEEILNTPQHDVVAKMSFDYIKSMRQNLSSVSPRILEIDDKATDGWSDVFQLMIYDKIDNEHFQSCNIDKYTPITDQYVTHIKNTIYRFNPDVVLLDMRLLSEDKDKEEVGEISGVKLLKLIRRDFMGIPVIITTASNKSWTFETDMSLGAEGYWIKEGIDDSYNVDKAVRNYARFIELLDHATQKEYKLLKKFFQTGEILKKRMNDTRKMSKNVFWWEDYKWPDGSSCSRSITKINNIFQSGLLLYNDYLYQFIMNYRPCNKDVEQFLISNIINKMFGIVEEIHLKHLTKEPYGANWDKKNQQWSANKNSRNDWLALILSNYRNKASHKDAGSSSRKYLMEFLNLFLFWFQMKNFELFTPPVRIRYNEWNYISKQLGHADHIDHPTPMQIDHLPADLN